MTNQEINDKVKRLKRLAEQAKCDRDFFQKNADEKQDTLDALNAEISALEITLKEQV